MYARVELVSTTAERAEWYFEGLYEGDSRYEGASSGPSDNEGASSRASDNEGPSSGHSDTEGFDSEDRSGRPVRHRQVRFSLPR